MTKIEIKQDMNWYKVGYDSAEGSIGNGKLRYNKGDIKSKLLNKKREERFDIIREHTKEWWYSDQFKQEIRPLINKYTEKFDWREPSKYDDPDSIYDEFNIFLMWANGYRVFILEIEGIKIL